MLGDLSQLASEDWGASAAQSSDAGGVLKSGSYRRDYFCFSVKSTAAVAPAFTDTF